MTLADLVAAVLLLAVTAYALFGGADFGAGFWDLTAGNAREGAQPRGLINRALSPVWEVNHVWLIFCLVVLWTAFPPAFASIMTTLSIPISLALLGIVLRGAGFAFHHEAEQASRQWRLERLFAISSILTPFFLGAAIGGIISGRVPVGNAAGDPFSSWLNPTSIFIGLLAVAVCAYLSAVYLVTDAYHAADPDLESYFRDRAIGAAVVAGLVSIGGIFVLRAEDPAFVQGLLQRGWILFLLTAVCGIGALVILRRGRRRWTRVLAAVAVAALVWGWGVAQYPYLLPDSLTIAAGAGAQATLVWLVIVVVAALLVVLPALLLVYHLDQKSKLEVGTLESAARENGTAARADAPAPVPNVVVIGGGFAGVAAAKGLEHAPVRVTLVDRTNYHLFQPLLYQVAAGILEPGTITSPIRSLFRGQPNVHVRMATVTGIDKDQRLVYLEDGDSLAYDYLVIATGVQASYFGHNEWAAFAPSMKSLADAEALRRRIVGALELAEHEPDPERRKELLTFVLVGAGPTGCELAGELAQHFRRLTAEYREINPRDARIILVEAGPRALPTFSESLAQGAVKKLESLGVEVRTGQAVQHIDGDIVVIAGEEVHAGTVLWTAGVTAPSVGSWLGVETDRAGRVVVGSDLTVKDYPEIFVVGDTAHIENDGKLLPGVAQVALQSGKHAAHTIRARIMHQRPPAPFSYFDKGNMATIASTYAIMEKDRLKLSGLPGKAGWAFIHVLYLGRAEGQLLICIQWIFAMVFGRTASRYIDTPSLAPEAVAAPAAPAASAAAAAAAPAAPPAPAPPS
jgi:NADH dehydrogenase FAD-containing subunit/cytochrome bd-type quinol oxidase subunit 2